MSAQQKFTALVEWMYRYDEIAVAFSGGTSSALLVCAAQEAYGKNALVLTANTPFFTKEELFRVHEVLDDYKLRDARIPVYLLREQDIVKNEGKRCALCRNMVYAQLLDAARGMGADTLAEGTCAGGGQNPCTQIKEARHEGVMSPLIELGYTREDAMDMLRAIGRGYYIRPAHSCLAQQIAVGERISVEILDFLEEAEKLVRGVLGSGHVYWNNGAACAFVHSLPGERERRRLEASLKNGGAASVAFRLEDS